MGANAVAGQFAFMQTGTKLGLRAPRGRQSPRQALVSPREVAQYPLGIFRRDWVEAMQFKALDLEPEMQDLPSSPALLEFTRFVRAKTSIPAVEDRHRLVVRPGKVSVFSDDCGVLT